MTTGSQGDAGPGESRPKRKVSPVRNVLGLVLLAGFGGTAASEFIAYRGHASAVAKMQGLIPTTFQAPKADAPSAQANVEKAIGLATPAKLKESGGERSATYNWRGVVRTHKITAYYTAADPPMLVRIDTE